MRCNYSAFSSVFLLAASGVGAWRYAPLHLAMSGKEKRKDAAKGTPAPPPAKGERAAMETGESVTAGFLPGRSIVRTPPGGFGPRGVVRGVGGKRPLGSPEDGGECSRPRTGASPCGSPSSVARSFSHRQFPSYPMPLCPRHPS